MGAYTASCPARIRDLIVAIGGSMQLRARDPERIRADALRLARRKLEEGCSDCAKAYFALASENGASDADLARVRRMATEPSARPGLGRRAFLRGAGVTAGAVATWSLLPYRQAAALGGLLESATTTPTPSTSVAWFTSDGAGAAELVGVDSTGHVVASIALDMKSDSLRLADRVLVVGPAPGAGVAQSSVSQYDASSGLSLGNVRGPSKALGTSNDFALCSFDVSVDGRYLAVLVQSSVSQPSSFVKAGKSVVLIEAWGVHLDLFDIVSGTLVSSTDLGTSSNLSPTASVLFNRDASQLAVFAPTRDLTTDQLTIVGFDGKALSPSAPAAAVSGSRVTQAALYSTPSAIVRFVGTSVQWLDLSGRLIDAVDVPPLTVGAKSYSASAVFTPDGASLITANAASGQIQLIDVVARKVTAVGSLPEPFVSVSTPLVPTWQGSMAISADGARLYIADAGNPQGGFWALSVPSLKVIGLWAPGTTTTDLWPTADGSSIFGIDPAAGVITLVNASSGAVVSQVTTQTPDTATS